MEPFYVLSHYTNKIRSKQYEQKCFDMTIRPLIFQIKWNTSVFDCAYLKQLESL